VRRADLRARTVSWCGVWHAHLDDIDRDAGMILSNPFRQPVVMHEHSPARLDDDAEHWPEVSEGSQQSFCTELCEVRIRIRVIEPELAPVILLAWNPLLQERASARVMELSVMKNNEAGIACQIRPHVVVAWRVAELIHDEIVRRARVLPDEVVRLEHVQARIADRILPCFPVDEQIDVVLRHKLRQQLPVVLGDAGFNRCKRREPRNP
jgi:hypothetical protein